jgi:photosystem II stability/assembly factor-like uncharacterized protein
MRHGHRADRIAGPETEQAGLAVGSPRRGCRAALIAALALLVAGAFLLGPADQALASEGAWLEQDPGTSANLNRVLFLDETEGWIVGDGATLLHTTDAGVTWVRQSIPVDSDCVLSGVDFIDRETGWIVGRVGLAEPPVVLHTEDGGLTWLPQGVGEAGKGDGFSDVEFIDPLNGIICGHIDRHNVAATGDGGDTWDCVERTELGNVSLADVHWLDRDDIVCSGTDSLYGGPLFLVSHDGGASWRSESAGVEASGGVDRVDFTDQSRGYAFVREVTDEQGEGPVLVSTDDGGDHWVHRHWYEIGLASSDRPYAIDFVDEDVAWAAGSAPLSPAGSNIWRTTDGGVSWQAEPHVPGMPLGLLLGFSDICFVTSDCGWAVGKLGTVLHHVGPADTTPPTTSSAGADARWHNTTVTVTFTAVDDLGGSGMTGGAARTEYRLDAGSWMIGASCTVSAAADHSGDGTHEVSYRSSDAAGNTEAVRSVTVKIDTAGPTTAGRAARGRTSRPLTLRYRVTDMLSTRATDVKLVVWNARGKVVKSFALGARSTAVWYGVTWKPKARGTYRYLVTGKDLAGNAQVRAGGGRMVVR